MDREYSKMPRKTASRDDDDESPFPFSFSFSSPTLSSPAASTQSRSSHASSLTARSPSSESTTSPTVIESPGDAHIDRHSSQNAEVHTSLQTLATRNAASSTTTHRTFPPFVSSSLTSPARGPHAHVPPPPSRTVPSPFALM